MGLSEWFTDQAIKAFFDRLEKGAIRISNLDETRDLIIWAAPQKKEKT